MDPDITQSAGGGAGIGIGMIIFYVILIVGLLAINWKIYEKAGKPGWTGIVPIYNLYILTEIVARPMLWFILTLVPCVNIVILLIMQMDLLKSFGKPAWAIFVPIYNIVVLAQMAFGDATYTKPVRAA